MARPSSRPSAPSLGRPLPFDANFLTNELTNGSGNPDQAYAYLFNGATLVAGLPLNLGTPTAATNPTGDGRYTCLRTKPITKPSPSTDPISPAPDRTPWPSPCSTPTTTLIDSGLAIDNIQTFGPTTVPLPAGVWAGLLGLALSLGVVYQMRRRMHVAA